MISARVGLAALAGSTAAKAIKTGILGFVDAAESILRVTEDFVDLKWVPPLTWLQLGKQSLGAFFVRMQMTDSRDWSVGFVGQCQKKERGTGKLLTDAKTDFCRNHLMPHLLCLTACHEATNLTFPTVSAHFEAEETLLFVSSNLFASRLNVHSPC